MMDVLNYINHNLVDRQQTLNDNFQAHTYYTLKILTKRYVTSSNWILISKSYQINPRSRSCLESTKNLCNSIASTCDM